MSKHLAQEGCPPDFLNPLNGEVIDLSRELAYRVEPSNFGAAALRAEYDRVSGLLNKGEIESELASRAQPTARTFVDDPFRPVSLLEDVRWQYGMNVEIDEIRRNDGLEQLRRQLRGLDDLAITRLNHYMDQTAERSFVRYARVIAFDSGRWASSDWHNWLANGATDEELMNMIEWHLHVLAEQVTDKDVQAAIAAQRSQFGNGLRYLAQANLLGSQPRPLEQARILIGDSFDTLLKGWGGYYAFKTQTVVLAEASGSDAVTRKSALLRSLPTVLTHELVHATIDKSRLVPGGTFAARWLEEAMTENVAHLLRMHDDPAAADSDAYGDERKIFEVLISKEEDSALMRGLSIRAFTGDDQAAAILSEKLNRAWGTDQVLEKISAKIHANERSYPDGLAPSVRESHAVADLLRALEYYNAVQPQDVSIIDKIIESPAALPVMDRTKKK